MYDFDILCPPDAVWVSTETDSGALDRKGDGLWRGKQIELCTRPAESALPVIVHAPKAAIKRILLRWNRTVPAGIRLLGDHWERAYGDLEWRGIVPERPLPWYFLLFDGKRTHACGVRTGAAALCFWQVDGSGISLSLDVRCGGRGVNLGKRRLLAATVLARRGGAGESPFDAAKSFCRMLCPKPLLPAQPVYGGNDWYCCYGKNSHEHILAHAETIASLAHGRSPNRPFMVVDMGWNVCSGVGPWQGDARRFPDMPGLAQAIRRMNVRPGIWIRPLRTTEDLPSSWFLPVARFPDTRYRGQVLDPSLPDVLEKIAADIRLLTGWGYELVKHDYTCRDLFGLWGFQMGAQVTPDGWAFADRSRTTAEIVQSLYRAIRQAAGEVLLIGCNTIGHLAAGFVEIQRTGDDTSGLDWERTRKMGINTLAFRMPQHGAFFAADADCVGLTSKVPWALNRQWLGLLAGSGTPLFVSIAPDACGPAQRRALKEAFARAARPLPPGEPLDWMDTTCPGRWRLEGKKIQFDWSDPNGSFPVMTNT